MSYRPTSGGIVGFVARHRAAATFLLLFLMAAPARPDDRQLLQANSGANTNVLLILDSSTSMNNDFSDVYRLPAFMDDFIYPQGTVNTVGSKLGVAKSVLRQVLTNTAGVNWAFSYYRNPQQTFGAADNSVGDSSRGQPPIGYPIGGATKAGDALENGGLEWMYFADTLYPLGGSIGSVLPSSNYPDVQQGRFLQMGHKVPHIYGTPGQPDLPPYTINPSNPDTRFPYPGQNPGIWRGAFGPKGLNEGLVVYRSPGKPGYELRMQIVSGNYSDPFVVVQIDEYGPPAAPTPTPSLTPTITRTPTSTLTPTNTSTPRPTRTQTNTPLPTNTITPTFTARATNTNTQTPTNTATRTNTATSTQTFTPSNTPTRTNTFTPSRTFTPSNTATRTATSTSTPTSTQTLTPSRTATFTSTPTRTNTFTATNTFTPSNTATRTFTPTITPTFTRTATFTRTFTPSNTFTPTNTFTASKTFTPSNTATKTFTPSNTQTFTPSNTATKTLTPSNTATKTLTPSNTATFTATKTLTPSNTATNTATGTFTPSRTNTPTRTFTPSNTPTGTQPPTKTFTPTLVPTLPGGHAPAGSLLPAIANWLAPAIRGLFAMAPPPPPPASPCPGIPATYTGGGQLVCGACPYDPTRLCAFVDLDGNGVISSGDPAAPNLIPLPATPNFLRGFDDPQADPDPTLVLVQSVQVKYTRGDLYNLPPVYSSNDSSNGNPPWGSCPTAGAGCPVAPDNDADGVPDSGSVANRHNQGAFSGNYDKERPRQSQQYPNDAFAAPSCPLGIPAGGCDPYSMDCGGVAHFNTFKGFPGSAPNALGPADASNPTVFPVVPPASPADWPVVPFRREWLGTDYPGGNSPEASIKRLLRFTSSIVSYDSAATADRAYTLSEDAKEVVVTAPGTPLAGALLDAYNYFVNSVFPTPPGGAPDPAIDCRNYIIVFVTDGHDECSSDPCLGGTTGLGPAGDLGQVLLPESASGRRAAANSIDPSVRVSGIPVFVVGLNSDPTFFPALNCIATNTGGKVFAATDRTSLQGALESILDFKRNANFFAAPSLPGFSGGVGDTAQIGSVVPSHLNPNGDLSSWSVWSGSVKSFQLDNKGFLPVVSGVPTDTPTPSGPTVTPGGPTPTPTPGPGLFLDETSPDDPNPTLRHPVWSAGRVLGYTNPASDLAAGAAPAPASPAARAPAITVWPGRKIVFARGSAGVPLTRSDFLPNTGSCSGAGTPGSCFDDLMVDMGLTPTSSPANQSLAKLTVQFLRGGISPFGSRDEVLNDPSIRPATIGVIGPNSGQENKFSYFYQDDPPIPGSPPQAKTDDDGSAPAGYAHKLGDIFHSEPQLLDPPQFFPYLASNLTPGGPGTSYVDFASLQAKRRRVSFVGANDGFLHAFDAGVWGRDTTNFPTSHDLGTGRELFAYSPRMVMGTKMPNLLNFPPLPQYFVDGSPATGDVFIDPTNDGVTPTASDRAWRTVLVGGLRQGGAGLFALDVTQPDDIVTTVGPNFGEISGNKDASPGCLSGTGPSCTAGTSANRKYPEVLWEFTDSGLACSDTCTATPSAPALGDTWSRPVIGRIKVITDPNPPFPTEDHYVAVFGGGFDPSFTAGDSVTAKLPRGRAFYMVDIETGQVLYKTTEGVAGDGGTGTFPAPVPFAPMPAAPGLIDFDDDGYMDIAYIGDVNGNMWRIDLTPDGPSGRGVLNSGQLSGYTAFMLFNGCGTSTGAGPCTNLQPDFFEPAVIFMGGSVNPPTLGISWGTGNRAELARPNVQTQSFYYIPDSGQTARTAYRCTAVGGCATAPGSIQVRDLTPGTGQGPCPAPFDPVSCQNAQGESSPGFALDFGSQNEKTTSAAFSEQGFLTTVTFTPDSVSPCATNGSSYQYRFFFLTGTGYYGTNGNMSDYRISVGDGVATISQSTTLQGTSNETVMTSGGPPAQTAFPGVVKTSITNWKEQQ
jgi:Neisseria PilC beta-propeller domain